MGGKSSRVGNKIQGDMMIKYILGGSKEQQRSITDNFAEHPPELDVSIDGIPPTWSVRVRSEQECRDDRVTTGRGDD